MFNRVLVLDPFDASITCEEADRQPVSKAFVEGVDISMHAPGSLLLELLSFQQRPAGKQDPSWKGSVQLALWVRQGHVCALATWICKNRELPRSSWLVSNWMVHSLSARHQSSFSLTYRGWCHRISKEVGLFESPITHERVGLQVALCHSTLSTSSKCSSHAPFAKFLDHQFST